MTMFRTGSIYFNQINGVGKGRGARIFLAPHPDDPNLGVGYLGGDINPLGDFDLRTGLWMRCPSDLSMSLLPGVEATYEDTKGFRLFRVGRTYKLAGNHGTNDVRTVESIDNDGLMMTTDSHGVKSGGFRSARTGKFLGFDWEKALQRDRNNVSYNSELDLMPVVVDRPLCPVDAGASEKVRPLPSKVDPSAARDSNHVKPLKAAPVRFDQFPGFKVESESDDPYVENFNNPLQRSTGSTDDGHSSFVNPIYKE